MISQHHQNEPVAVHNQLFPQCAVLVSCQLAWSHAAVSLSSTVVLVSFQDIPRRAVVKFDVDRALPLIIPKSLVGVTVGPHGNSRLRNLIRAL